jgi:RimJ/RimL family protein N-acetyltransferase
MTPHEIWPVFDLCIRTPRLELRPAHGDLAFALAALAGEGIHDPEVMPFLMPWTDVEPPELQRNSMRYFFNTWAGFRPESWSLPFAVLALDGDGNALEVVGNQSVHQAVDFPIAKTFETGSWLGRAHQGQGIGKEMRQAVLHFMFEGLGAQVATTGAFTDNPASLAVTRALGYVDNGSRQVARRGKPATELLFLLTRERWLERRRDDITIDGLDAHCLAFFGLAADTLGPEGDS